MVGKVGWLRLEVGGRHDTLDQGWKRKNEMLEANTKGEIGNSGGRIVGGPAHQQSGNNDDHDS